mmetsp:Transcript_37997/g.63887  ORF Transcript_37997/g.63887 Transcript_37997/m.63887 type:complete len:243 (+) Transcript_37997:148-876(+)
MAQGHDGAGGREVMCRAHLPHQLVRLVTPPLRHRLRDHDGVGLVVELRVRVVQRALDRGALLLQGHARLQHDVEVRGVHLVQLRHAPKHQPRLLHPHVTALLQPLELNLATAAEARPLQRQKRLLIRRYSRVYHLLEHFGGLLGLPLQHEARHDGGVGHHGGRDAAIVHAPQQGPLVKRRAHLEHDCGVELIGLPSVDHLVEQFPRALLPPPSLTQQPLQHQRSQLWSLLLRCVLLQPEALH